MLLINKALLISVFITGFISLSVEVVAFRILSPFFGNTIFTTSAVISVVLAALSFGYYFGGKLADKYHSYKYFYLIISFSGLAVLFINSLSYLILPIFRNNFSIITGPLISSLLLFFVPSFLLGILSPYAIKLLKMNSKIGIGEVSGKVFFASTVGSIFGTLTTGFVLIPFIGILEIINFSGLVLLTLGLSFLYFTKRWSKNLKTILLIGLFFYSLNLFTAKASFANTLLSKDGVYEKLRVVDGEIKGTSARFFYQDLSLSGAMFLENTELVLDYTKYYSLYKIKKDPVKRVYIIGGGIYTVPKKLLEELGQDAVVEVTEIEPELYEISKKYFNLTDDKRLINIIGDGRKHLYESNNTYDFIFSDAYHTIYSIPAHMTTREFYELVYNRLNDEGIFVANLIGNLSRQTPSFIFSQMKTFKEIFRNSYYFAVDSADSTSTQNIIFMGFKSDKKITFDDMQKNADPILSNLKNKIIDTERFDLIKHTTFTDNFSPADYFTAQLLKNEIKTDAKSPDGSEILALINQQDSYGPRFIGGNGHKKIQNFLEKELKIISDNLTIQEFEYKSKDGTSYKLKNFIAQQNINADKKIILATHYDSKRYADLDDNYPESPVPGANDSASGVAVLIELARLTKDSENLKIGIDFIFFDGEEGEPVAAITDWHPIGSTYFSENTLKIYPKKRPVYALVLDMVCDKNLKIFKEGLSFKLAPEETDIFWKTASNHYPDVFINQIKYEISDDHIPLNKAGIPSILIIDFDYPYFHKTSDTADKCSVKSLEIVAKVIYDYIHSQQL